MYETAEDLERLQRLLDDSYEGAGEHLRSIFTPERRVPAADLAGLLPGVQVLHLGTVTAGGEPRVAPVDGLFYRGRLWFGSSPTSARFRHIRARPQVSGTITKGEEFAVIVHGRAHEISTAEEATKSFVDYLLEVYGDGWRDWGSGAAYAWIEAARMFTFRSTGQAGR